MACGEGFSSNKAPLFYVINYAFWKIRIQAYLYALGFDILESFSSSYTTYTTSPTDAYGKKWCYNDSNTINVLICGLFDSELVKIISYKLAK